MDNVDRLEDAGVLDPGGLTKDQKDTINGLDPDEIEQLIAIKKKTGSFEGAEGGRPWLL